MKKRLTALFLMTSFLGFGLQAWAQETGVAEPIAALTASAKDTDTFRIQVTGNGRLITKPGQVFTEGIEAPGTQLPYLTSTPKPIPYPRWALRQGWQGELVLALEVLTDGHVGRMMVMKSTGHDVLDQAGSKAARGWLFQPALQNGKPILSCIQIPIVFQIDDEK